MAEISPRPDAPAVMRKLPDRRKGKTSPFPRLGPDAEVLSLGLRPEGGASVDGQLRPDGAAACESELRLNGVGASEPELVPDRVACVPELRLGGAGAAPPSGPARPAWAAPLAPGRYKVQFTA